MKNTQRHHPLIHWFFSHAHACRSAITALARHPFLNTLITFMIGIAVALPLGFFLLLQNINYVDSTWNATKPTISLYLNTSASQNTIDALLNQLRNNPDIKKVSYISPSDGLKNFEKNTSLSGTASLFQTNPIPPTIIVTPVKQEPVSIQKLYQSLKALPTIDVAQLDLNWATRLYNIVAIGKNITTALSLIFCFSVVVIIGHTLRSSLSHHKNEIYILRLMGATQSYIRRPLLYRGIFYGLLGGMLAWFLTALFIAQLQTPVTALAETYHTLFRLKTLSFMDGLALLLITALLGFLSAWFNIGGFLKENVSGVCVSE